MLGALSFLVGIVYGTPVYSGGVYVEYNGDTNLYNYNISEITSTFGPTYSDYQFLYVYTEINYIYYSIYNKTSNYNELFRARPDGSNVQYILTYNYNLGSVCKVGIDTENQYIYYAYGDYVYRALVNGQSPTAVLTDYNYLPVSVTFDTSTQQIAVYANTLYIYTNTYRQIAKFTIASYNIFVDIALYQNFYLISAYDGSVGECNLYNGTQKILLLDTEFSPIEIDMNNGKLYTVNSSQIIMLDLDPPFWITHQIAQLSGMIFTNQVLFIAVSSSECSKDCLCNGDCLISNNEPTCACYPNYYGDDCSCGPNTCDNGGECNEDGDCICANNYYGVICDVFCDEEITCNGHGSCTNEGVCSCDSNHAGPACNKTISSFTGGFLSQAVNFNQTAIFNFNFSSISSDFSLQNVQYALINPNEPDYIYHSYYDGNTYLLRSKIDGTNTTLISQLTFVQLEVETIQKFSINKNSTYLFFGLSTTIYKWSFADQTISPFITEDVNVLSVQVDPITDNIWAMYKNNTKISNFYLACFEPTGGYCADSVLDYYEAPTFYAKDFTVFNQTVVVSTSSPMVFIFM